MTYIREELMKPDILEQAANWLDQENELTSAEKSELNAWLANPEHMAAYKKMQGLLNSDALSDALQQSSDSTVVCFEQTRKKHVSVAMAASLAFVCILAYILMPYGNEYSEPRQTTASTSHIYEVELSSPIAERKSSVLDDGSQVHLNANSALSVSQTKNKRFAVLEQGQVFFDIAPDKNRPFIINTGNAEITVLGTSFDVKRTPQHTTVSVYEGTVNVKADKKVTLTKGHSIKVQAGKIVNVSEQTFDILPLWRAGWLEVDNTPIDEVIAQFQAYLDKKVVFDERLSGLLINGRFALDRPEESLMLISNTNQLEFVNETQRIVIQAKN